MLLVGLAVGLGIGEAAMRLFYEESGTPGLTYYRDLNREPLSPEEALARGMMPLVEPAPPRPVRTFAPGLLFYICYQDYPQPWFDDLGCVEVRFNSSGIRDREEIGFDKPEGQKRILCIGDSFTFGWGVNVEDCWTRLVETELRQTLGDVVTVNCGNAGASMAEEYWWGLRDRFHRFQPDMVVVTLCLNDLFVSNGGVAHLREKPDTGLLLLDQLQFLVQGSDPLRLDPDVDYVDMLVNLPADHPLYTDARKPEFFWGSGTPQESLRQMRDWCAARDIPFAVILWPYVQGLGTDHYPFTEMHQRVAEFCQVEGIEFLDLLPKFRNVRAQDLWVTPSDLHYNPRGHRLAVGPIARFLASGFPRKP